MLPYTVSTLDNTYISFQTYYISKYGVSKFEKVENKVLLSNKMAELNGLSIQMRAVPTARDFVTAINSMAYFMFASTDTTILACLIAMKQWNERINSTYHFVTQSVLDYKVQSLFNMFGLLY